MKISSAGAVEARIWKWRADGQPGFLEPLSFCLLSDSGTGRIWRIYGGTRIEGFLEISLADVWHGADGTCWVQSRRFCTVFPRSWKQGPAEHLSVIV